MTCVLLGAGFSKWAAGLPTATGLFDFSLVPYGVREVQKLKKVQHAKQSWDRQYPQGLAEQFIAHMLSSGPEHRALVQWYLARRLSEPYIFYEMHAWRLRRHVLMIDENRRLHRPGVKEAQQFLCQLQRSCRLRGLITTNYDLLVEYALGSNGFNYGVQGERLLGRGPYPLGAYNKGPVTLDGALPFAKLHGSISWDVRGRYTEGRRGITGNALIVAPTPEKVPPVALADQWELAGRILRRSERLVVFGFAFNPYDESVLTLFRTEGQNLRRILLIDPDPPKARVGAMWPNAEIATLMPPKFRETAPIQLWLRL